MNSFSAVERALEAEFARQCGAARCRRARRAADDALGRRRGGGAAGAIEGGEPRLSLLPGSRPSAARRRGRARSSRSVASCPSCRRRDARGITTTYPALTRRTTSTCSPRAARSATTSSEVATAERRSEGRGELGARRGARVAQGDGSADRRSFASARPSSPTLLALVRDGVVSHTRGQADLRRHGRDAASAPRAIAEREGLLKVSDDDAARRAGSTKCSPSTRRGRRAFVGGERQLQGVLVGFVMKKSNGRADPKRVNQLLATRAGS